MKRWICLALAAAMCLGLCACGEKQAPFDVEATPETLLEAPGVFSEDLEALERVIVDFVYDVKDTDGVVDAASYISAGATAEELTVLTFESEQTAETFLDKALAHVESVREANVDYRPQEMPKIEKALVEQRGASVLVLICADREAAEALLG